MREQGWVERVLGVMIGTAPQDARLALGRMTRSRIGPLRKTSGAVRDQSPEMAMRPLEDIASTLAVEEILAEDARKAPSLAVQELKRQIIKAIERCTERVVEVSAQHVAEWQ